MDWIVITHKLQFNLTFWKQDVEFPCFKLRIDMCKNIPNPLAFVVQYQSSDAKVKRYSCWYAFFHDFQKFSIGKIYFFPKN